MYIVYQYRPMWGGNKRTATPSHSHLLALALVLDEGGDLGQQRIELRIHLLLHLEHLLLLLGLDPGDCTLQC